MKIIGFLSARAGSILAILFTLFLISCLYKKSGSGDTNDLAEMNLKGKVKSISETVNFTGNEPSENNTGENHYRHLCRFDKRGKKLEEIYYWKDSILSSRIVYKYDAYGYLIERLTMDNAGNTDSRIIYKYDEKKNLYQKLELNHLSYLVYRETYKYDLNFYEVERFIYRPSQSEWNIIISYDESGELVKKSFTTTKGGSVMKIVYENDKNGNKTEEKFLKKDGSVGTRYTHKYDRAGRITETIMYNSSDKFIFSTIYTYDKNSRTVVTRYDLSEVEPEPDQILKYDEKGNLTENIINNGLRISREVSEYVFDEKGNWIKKKVTEYLQKTGEVVVVNIIRREIEYY